jgi:hypothetical protein
MSNVHHRCGDPSRECTGSVGEPSGGQDPQPTKTHKGARKNNFPFSRPDLGPIWAIRLSETAGVAGYVEGFATPGRPKMARSWDAKMGSCSFPGPKNRHQEEVDIDRAVHRCAPSAIHVASAGNVPNPRHGSKAGTRGARHTALCGPSPSRSLAPVRPPVTPHDADSALRLGGESQRGTARSISCTRSCCRSSRTCSRYRCGS